MSESELNDAGLFIERYGNGFMLADYREGDDARYFGSDFLPRRQPITDSPFADQASAVAAGTKLLAGQPLYA